MREIQSCRSCNGTQLEPLLDLGELYVSDFVENGAGHKAPLELVRCATCTLVQLRHTVPSAWHYEHGYWYRSGTNEQMVAQLRDVVEDTVGRVRLQQNDIVLDIGANDGTLLGLLADGITKVGCDPARNLHTELAKFVDVIIPTFWSTDAYTTGIPTYRRNKAENQQEQRTVLVGDDGSTLRSTAPEEDKRKDQDQPDGVVEAAYAPSIPQVAQEAIAVAHRQEVVASDTPEDESGRAQTVRYETVESSEKESLPRHRLEDAHPSEGEGPMRDLPQTKYTPGGGSYQTVRTLPETSNRPTKRAGTLSEVPLGVRLAWQPSEAKVIFCIAAFYDLDDPNSFLAAIKDWLASDGLFVVQMAYAPAMLRTNDIGNISHEHLEYYTVKSLANLLFRHGLMIDAVSFNDVNGGSFRCFIKHGYGGIRKDPDWADLDWAGFAERVEENKYRTLGMLTAAQLDGKTVAGYGASTRGNTVLQAYGIGPDLLPYIAERNPAKWGKKTVGSNIPIISEDEMRTRKPDYLFVLPFHLIESFKQREPEYVGRFIVPLPEPRVE